MAVSFLKQKNEFVITRTNQCGGTALFFMPELLAGHFVLILEK